jgi:predicted metal-dependent hydrolase
MSYIAKYESVGEVHFLYIANIKRITISVKPFEGIIVKMPISSSIDSAQQFVSKHIEWIKKAKLRVAELEKRRTIFTTETNFSTKNKALKIFAWKSEQFRVQTLTEELRIFYPDMLEISSDIVQEFIRNQIINTLKKEAKEYLPQRTAQLAAKHNFSYNEVSVKNLKSRWGSCSSTNHINLNIHLMRLPEHLSDYVILHELAHTVHKNHGTKFWQTVDILTIGKTKELLSEMKRYSACDF